jgi:hypothetical protein
MNDLTGSIPANIGKLTALAWLDVGRYSLRRFNARESVYTLPPLILSIPTGGTAQNRLAGTLPTELERLDLLNPRYPELSPWFQGGLVLTSENQDKALEWHETDPGRISSPGEIVERFVLAVIYFATNGGQWNRNDLWLSGGLIVPMVWD